MVLAFAHAGHSQTVDVSEWGRTAAGEKVQRYTLTNANRLKAAIITYGATLIAVETPDRSGAMANITLHLASFRDYEKGHPLFGSIVGRYANRIDTGGFTIDGKRFDLETVNPKTGVHIHGGKKGVQKLMWNAKPTREDEAATVTLTHISPDGHEGFPGKVTMRVTYRLSNDDSLSIKYEATTDAPTHINLSNHVYWNLDGAGVGNILGHRLTLNADKVLTIDSRKIPTGEFTKVGNTPFDFRKPQTIGAHISEVAGGGYDHCYALNNWLANGPPILFARIESAASGRVLEALTTEPGVQLYTANYLKSTLNAPSGRPYGPYHGICLETQRFPDSPNKPQFPSTMLRPGETYRQLTVFRFTVAK